VAIAKQPQRVVAGFKQPQRVVACEEMPLSEIRVVAVRENNHNALWHNGIARTRRGPFLLQPQQDVR
jgi:hypothetical protein